MLAGEWFHPNDAELEQDRTRARHLTHRLNVTLKDKDATYLATLRELCPGVEAMIRAPFYCDYGYNISIGKGSYVNFNCVFLDLGPIRLGQRCLIGPGVQLLTAVHPMDATERATGKEKGAGIEIGDDCWLGGGVIVQRFGDLIRGKRSTEKRIKESFTVPTLNAAAGDLSLVLPKRILDGIIEMIYALDKVAPGTANDDTLLYGVEVKFYNMEVEVDSNLMTCHDGLYIIGDGSGITHSLSHASASGVHVARQISKQ